MRSRLVSWGWWLEDRGYAAFGIVLALAAIGWYGALSA